MFCIPGAGASSSFYGQWLSHAPAALEVALLELPGRGARLEEAHPGRLEDIVGELVELLARTARPFAIFAHSMGSLVAFELTRQLEQRERPPLHLFVSAFSAPRSQPSTPLSAALALPDREFLAMARRLGFVSSEISRRYDDEIRAASQGPTCSASGEFSGRWLRGRQRWMSQLFKTAPCSGGMLPRTAEDRS